MIATWMLYCVVMSALLALAALSLEYGFRLRNLPLRWAWVGALLSSFFLAAVPWLSSPLPEGVASNRSEASTEGSQPAVLGRWITGPSQPSPSRRPVLPSPVEFDKPLLLAWALLSGSSVLVLLGAQWRLQRRRRKWRFATVDRVPALISRDVGPAVVGFLGGDIVLPEWVLGLDPAQRRLVLSHEEEHRRAGDAPLLALALTSLVLMPWNLPLWWQVRRLRLAVEIDCDARVLRGCTDVRGYSRLLVAIGERRSLPGIAFAGFAESTSFLERRLRTMLAPRPQRWRLPVGISGVIAVGFLGFACETPRPTMPAADAAPKVLPRVQHQAPATAEEPMQDRVVTIPDSLVPSAAGGVALVQRLQPAIYSNGLPYDRALWIAMDGEGRVRNSWVGPNLYVNFDEGPRPDRESEYPRGSAEAERARLEGERKLREVVRAHVPGMNIQSGWFAVFYRLGPEGAVLHFVTEAPGTPWPWPGLPDASHVVRKALRAEARRLSDTPQ